jgi:hypothetical protein
MKTLDQVKEISVRYRSETQRSVLVIATALLLTACLSGGGGGGEEGTTSSAPAPAPPPTTCASVTYDAPSGAANNIVFTFNKPYVCGQFANGDWWVSVDGSGTVTISSITPAAAGGMNGFQVNPTNTDRQAFDSRINFVFYDAALMPSLPLTLPGVSSVIKAVSVAAVADPQLQFAAVLTVVNAPITNSSEVFRPGYFASDTVGNPKTFYNTSSIRVSSLPRYTPVGVPSAATYPIAGIVTRYRHVQLDHIVGWTAGDLHPLDNMPDYGAQIASDNAVNLLRMLLSDFDYANPTHKQALVNYLQMAIDFRSMAAGGVFWGPDGGHGNGRKLPLLFAAFAFGSTDFSNAIALSSFSEDQQVWRGVGGVALFGSPTTESGYWQQALTGTGARDARDPYGQIDGGGAEIGGAYQFCCTAKPWKYTVLALYMLGLESAWGNGNTLIDYVERWVASGATALPDTCAPYDGNPANYGITFGPNGAGGCIPGAGRYPASNGINPDGGFYGATLGDELWAWWP